MFFLLLIAGKHPGKITFSFSAAPVRGTPGPQPILEGLSLKGIHGADTELATHRVNNVARGRGHTDASVREGSLPPAAGAAQGDPEPPVPAGFRRRTWEHGEAALPAFSSFQMDPVEEA